jgi:hypothetical protein
MMKAAADGGIGAAQLTLARWLDAGENMPADAQLALTWSVCARATFGLHWPRGRMCAWPVSSGRMLVRGCARVRASAVARVAARLLARVRGMHSSVPAPRASLARAYTP